MYTQFTERISDRVRDSSPGSICVLKKSHYPTCLLVGHGWAFVSGPGSLSLWVNSRRAKEESLNTRVICASETRASWEPHAPLGTSIIYS